MSVGMKTVLVTGTSTGIGEHIVQELLTQHTAIRVIGVSRRAVNLQDKRYIHVQGDVTTSETQEEIAQTVGGHLDGAVFNAGILDAVAPVSSLDIAGIQHVFNVNLFSVLSLVQRLLPALREAKGNAIFVSSGASTNAYYGWAAYGASKAALNIVVKTLAKEEPEIGCLAVAPGVVDTDMQSLIRTSHVPSMGSDGAKFLDLKKSGKLVDPRESGQLYARLALGFDRNLNGQYLRYDDPVISS